METTIIFFYDPLKFLPKILLAINLTIVKDGRMLSENLLSRKQLMNLQLHFSICIYAEISGPLLFSFLNE